MTTAQSGVAPRWLILLLILICSMPLCQAATVAHWRFEVGPAGSPVLHPGSPGTFYGAIPDVSGNGNSLSAWSQGEFAGFAYRSDVPFALVPQDGASNRFSVKNTGSYPALFTSAEGSLPAGINAQAITPLKWTVEASYKPEASASYRTVVGRDARYVSAGNGDLAAFYLQVRPDDSVGVTFTDVSGYTHSAYSPPGWLYGFYFSSNPEGIGAPWYNLVATSDGITLRMYVNNVLVASTDLTRSGSPNRALAAGTTSTAEHTAGGWSVGRGLYAGGHTDRAYGFIDEVRISNVALSAGEFLAVQRPLIQITTVDGTGVSLSVRNGQPGATCYVLQSPDALWPISEWTAVATRTFDANGSFTHPLAIDRSVSNSFFHVRAVLKTPGTGPLRYQLAGGSETWPADIRAQIIYAMDGAVALYNRYGTFNKLLTANYNPGVPTAQAGYSGWIDFGNQRGYRTALHEISHALGVGTIWNWGNLLQGGVWTGPNGVQKIREFDGPAGTIHSDGTHFWPYGLNYENEGGTENNRRHVILVEAFRKDMGIQ